MGTKVGDLLREECWWMTVAGRRWPVIAGSQKDGDGDGDGDGSEGDGDENEEGNEEGNEEEEGKDEKDKDKKITILENVNARLHKKTTRLERQIDGFKTTVTELQDQLKEGVKDADQSLKNRVAELEAEIVSKDEDASGLMLQIGLYEHEKLEGLSSARKKNISRMVLPDLEVEDGEITNLDDLLDDLEKTDPTLFKSGKGSGSEEEEDEEDESEEDEASNGKSKRQRSRPLGQGKKKSGADEATLVQKFPLLAGRMKPSGSKTR